MNLQRIAVKLTETDLRELIARYVMNDAVEQLKIDGRPVTVKNLMSTSDSRKQLKLLFTERWMWLMFDHISSMYTKGGWKQETKSGGYVVVLEYDDVNQLRGELEELMQRDAELLKDQGDTKLRRAIEDRIARRELIMAKLA